MDMLFSQSLYPVNAMAYADSFDTSRAAQRDFWHDMDDMMEVTAPATTGSATDMQSSPHRQQRAPAPLPRTVAPPTRQAVENASSTIYPLSYGNVMSRYR